MTKRTNQTKTTIYRRHAPSCALKGQPLATLGCECPLWLHGKVRGEFIRMSLDTRSAATAQLKQSDIENMRAAEDAAPLAPTKLGGETLEFAKSEFLKTTTKLSTSTQTLYKRAVEDFAEWATDNELVLLRLIDSAHIRQYFEANNEWKKNTAQTRLTHLRVFFNYCHKTKRWLQFTPTADRTLNPRKANSSTRKPFTPAEVTKIFAAVEQMPEDVRDRARALIYLLLFTGMRISDATFFERDYVIDNNADYCVIKTRRPIALPPALHECALDALAKLPASRVYYFQPDADDDYAKARAALRDGEEFSTLMPNYRSRIEATTTLVLRVLALAGITGTCHKFRDTFAINLLVGDGEKGTDIFTVSQMLGHSDVKITQNHYLKLIPGYRERMSKSTRVLSYQFPKAN